jgi:DNA-binding beta-propeller fold protein YncE
MRGSPRRCGGSAAIALLLLALVPASAAGRGLHVSAVSCITGNTRVAARRGCPTVPGAGYEGGERSGLDDVRALAADASRTSLYAVGSETNSTLAQLGLAPSGALSFAACVTGDSFVEACPHLPGATANAVESPLAYPNAAAISPDGRSLYVISGSFHASVLARFARDPASGALAYEGCLTGDLGAGPTGPAACAPLPSATSRGFDSGFYEPSGVVVSSDGAHVYVTAAGDGSVASFDRDPAGGALAFVQCVSSDPGASGCVHTPGGHPILEGIGAPWISPDGRYLYGAAARAATVSAFSLGGGGTIAFASCVSGRDDRRPCRQGRDPEGPAQALTDPGGLAGSADGRFLYASSTYGTIVALRRNRASGALEPASCISSNAEDRDRCATVPAIPQRTKGTHHATLLTGVRTPLLTGARAVLAPVRTTDGLAELDRNPRTGALAFRGCASADLSLSAPGKGPCQRLPGATGNGANSGFYKTTALIPAPGNLLYAAASGDATVSLLRP